MKHAPWLYPLLNGVFHVVHIAVIIFVMVGWIFAPLRLMHLVLTMLTLSSWFVLGYWLGTGYCPISDWHWKTKEALGEGKPNGTYIHQLLKRISRQDVDNEIVDKAVVISTLIIAFISLGLNLRDWLTN